MYKENKCLFVLKVIAKTKKFIDVYKLIHLNKENYINNHWMYLATYMLSPMVFLCFFIYSIINSNRMRKCIVGVDVIKIHTAARWIHFMINAPSFKASATS